jgi:hypothetical protein
MCLEEKIGLLLYKKNAEEVIKRITSLLEGEASDRIFASFVLPSEAMKDFQKRYTESFFSEYPDPFERVAFWDRHLQGRTLLEDDSIPYAYPSEFDQGLYGGMLGGDVRFLAMAEDGWVSSGWISSMVPPLLKNLSDLDTLSFNESNVWLQRYKKQLGIMTDTAREKFGIAHLILIDGLNFVFELIGATDTYLSIEDSPELVRKAIDLGFDINLKVHDTFFDIVGGVNGGTCSWVIPWLPGRIICESVDPFHMTSIDYFEKWGREPIDRIFKKYDGGVLHIHANGRHLTDAVSTIAGLKALLFVDEKDHPPVFSILDDLKKRSGGIPVSVYANYKDFTERLNNHTLPGGTFYYVSGAENADEVNRCMEKVREYRT